MRVDVDDDFPTRHWYNIFFGAQTAKRRMEKTCLNTVAAKGFLERGRTAIVKVLDHSFKEPFIPNMKLPASPSSYLCTDLTNRLRRDGRGVGVITLSQVPRSIVDTQAEPYYHTATPRVGVGSSKTLLEALVES
jgi:hypothetical protein